MRTWSEKREKVGQTVRSVCVLVCVFDLTSSLVPLVDSVSDSFPYSQFSFLCVADPLFLREALCSGTLVCNHLKKGKELMSRGPGTIHQKQFPECELDEEARNAGRSELM